MSGDYLFFYVESMVVCSIVFGILLINDMIHGERDERKVHFDNVLIAHILYFIVDSFWAAVLDGALPKTVLSVLALNYALLVLLSLIASTWFEFAIAAMDLPWRSTRRGKLMSRLPMILTAAVSLVWMIADKSAWVDDQLNTTTIYQLFFLAAPVFYIISSFICSIGQAFRKENILNRKLYIILGIYPVTVLLSGIIQILLLNAPFFCFNSMIMIILFNLLSMENQISLDPLTRLNNRGQLMRYIMQDASVHKEGMRTFVVMADANDFKKINDDHGHVEGDRALIMIADTLRAIAAGMDIPPFIARYGGDEFVMVVYLDPKADAESMLGGLEEKVNRALEEACAAKGLKYTVAMSVGYEEIGDRDTFQTALVRADERLYNEKKATGVGR